ncbi:MAG: methylenetetrahydrofolate--tRNA-(uracil(54)-C(5))-methyltransferase (FADH(2)-oxidizing) TrmFO, partial [Candidatus Hydrothermia bacterium]
EGYLEAAAGGLVAGTNAARFALGSEPLPFPPHTAIGTLFSSITNAPERNYQPINLHLALFTDVPKNLRGSARREFITKRAIKEIEGFVSCL